MLNSQADAPNSAVVPPLSLLSKQVPTATSSVLAPPSPSRPAGIKIAPSRRLELSRSKLSVASNALTASVTPLSVREGFDVGFFARGSRVGTPMSASVVDADALSSARSELPFNVAAGTHVSRSSFRSHGPVLPNDATTPSPWIAKAPAARGSETVLSPTSSNLSSALADVDKLAKLAVSPSALISTDQEVELILRATAHIKRLEGQPVVSPRPHTVVEMAWLDDEDDDFDKYGKATDSVTQGLFTGDAPVKSRIDGGSRNATTPAPGGSRMLRAVTSATGRRLRFDRSQYAHASAEFGAHATTTLPLASQYVANAVAASTRSGSVARSSATSVAAASIIANTNAATAKASASKSSNAVNTISNNNNAGRRGSVASVVPPQRARAGSIYNTSSDLAHEVDRLALDVPVVTLHPDMDGIVDANTVLQLAATCKQMGPPRHLLTVTQHVVPTHRSPWVTTPSRDADARGAPPRTTGPDVGPGTYHPERPASKAQRPGSAKFLSGPRFADEVGMNRPQMLVNEEVQRMANERWVQKAKALTDARGMAITLASTRTSLREDPTAYRNIQAERALAASHRRKMLEDAKLAQSVQEWDDAQQAARRKQIKMWATAITVVTTFYRFQLAVKRHRAKVTGDNVFRSWMPIKRAVFDAWRAYWKSQKLLWATVVLRINFKPVVKRRIAKKRKKMADVVVTFLRATNLMVDFARCVRLFTSRVRRVQRWFKRVYKLIVAQRALVLMQWDIVEVQIRVAVLKQRLLRGHRRTSVSAAIERIGERLERRITQIEDAMKATQTKPVKHSKRSMGLLGRALLAWPTIRSTAEREDLEARFVVGLGILKNEGPGDASPTKARRVSRGFDGKDTPSGSRSGKRSSLVGSGEGTAGQFVRDMNEEARWDAILAEALRQAAVVRALEAEHSAAADAAAEKGHADSNASLAHSEADLSRPFGETSVLHSPRTKQQVAMKPVVKQTSTPQIAAHRRVSFSKQLAVGPDAIIDVTQLVEPTQQNSASAETHAIVHNVTPARRASMTEEDAAARAAAEAPDEDRAASTRRRMAKEMADLQRDVLDEYPPIPADVKVAHVIRILQAARRVHLHAIRVYRSRIHVWDDTVESQVRMAEERIRAIRSYISPEEAAAVRALVIKQKPLPPVFIALQPYQDLEKAIRTLFTTMAQERRTAIHKQKLAQEAEAEANAEDPLLSMTAQTADRRQRRASAASMASVASMASMASMTSAGW